MHDLLSVGLLPVSVKRRGGAARVEIQSANDWRNEVP